MPRNIPIEIESSWDRQQSDDAVVCFLTLQHQRLGQPQRIVSSPFGDNVGNHVLGGVLYAAIPFRVVIASDDSRLARGSLELLNYGFEIGRLAQMLKTRPRLTIEFYAARDFTEAMTGTPAAHQPIDAPRRLYRWAWATITNVSGETWISGDLGPYGPDPASEPASPMRATQDLFPGLFV